MGFLDKVTSFLKSEAKDIGEMAESAKDKFDEGLTAREEALEQTPADKIRDIQENAKAQDAEFDRILTKADAKVADQTAEAEVAELAADVSTGSSAEAGGDVMDALDPVADSDTEAVESETDSASEAAEPDTLSGVDQAAADAEAKAAQAASDAGDAAPQVAAASVPPVKSDAQIRYEQAKASADDLLNELRGELDADGQI